MCIDLALRSTIRDEFDYNFISVLNLTQQSYMLSFSPSHILSQSLKRMKMMKTTMTENMNKVLITR